jgi:hypothetical protein
LRWDLALDLKRESLRPRPGLKARVRRAILAQSLLALIALRLR